MAKNNQTPTNIQNQHVELVRLWDECPKYWIFDHMYPSYSLVISSQGTVSTTWWRHEPFYRIRLAWKTISQSIFIKRVSEVYDAISRGQATETSSPIHLFKILSQDWIEFNKRVKFIITKDQTLINRIPKPKFVIFYLYNWNKQMNTVSSVNKLFYIMELKCMQYFQNATREMKLKFHLLSLNHRTDLTLRPDLWHY